MFGLKIFVRVQTFWRAPPVLPCNFCHPDAWKLWYFFLQKQHLTCIPNVKSFPVYRSKWARELDLRKWESVSFKATAARRSRVFLKQLQLTQLLQKITNKQYMYKLATINLSTEMPSNQQYFVKHTIIRRSKWIINSNFWWLSFS